MNLWFPAPGNSGAPRGNARRGANPSNRKMRCPMHRRTPVALLLLTSFGCCALAWSADKPTHAEDLDLTLDMDAIEPTVTVQEHHNRVEEQYSVNNNVYMVKITPSAGPAYYLVDPDGDGNMEMRRNSAGMDINVPQWSLFKW